MRETEQRRIIVEYIKRNLKKGYTLEALKWALINQEYSKVLVDKALEQATKEMSEEAPILRERPKINYQIVDENNNPVEVKKPFWKRIFGL